MVILDTSILIDTLRQIGKQNTLLMKFLTEYPREVVAVSVLSVQELYEGKSTKEEQKEREMLAIINSFKLITYTYEIASLAGKIARDHSPIEFPDAGIAATAIVNQAKLLTLNKRDFEKIKDLELTG